MLVVVIFWHFLKLLCKGKTFFNNRYVFFYQLLILFCFLDDLRFFKGVICGKYASLSK